AGLTVSTSFANPGRESAGELSSATSDGAAGRAPQVPGEKAPAPMTQPPARMPAMQAPAILSQGMPAFRLAIDPFTAIEACLWLEPKRALGLMLQQRHRCPLFQHGLHVRVLLTQSRSSTIGSAYVHKRHCRRASSNCLRCRLVPR